MTTPSQLTMADAGFNRDSFASLKYFKICDQVLPFDATYGMQAALVEGLELLDVSLVKIPRLSSIQQRAKYHDVVDFHFGV